MFAAAAAISPYTKAGSPSLSYMKERYSRNNLSLFYDNGSKDTDLLVSKSSEKASRFVYVKPNNTLGVLSFGGGAIGNGLVAFSTSDSPTRFKPASIPADTLKKQVLALTVPSVATSLDRPVVDDPIPLASLTIIYIVIVACKNY